MANIAPNTHQAYVGSSAFSHKAGLHASAIKVDPELYNHLKPEVVAHAGVIVTDRGERVDGLAGPCVETDGDRVELELRGATS